MSRVIRSEPQRPNGELPELRLLTLLGARLINDNDNKIRLQRNVPHFQLEGRFIDAMPYGSGHINDTYASRFRWARM